MHRTLVSLVMLGVLTTSCGAAAQDLKEIPPPTPPFVASVPENADWTITVQYPPKPPPPPDAPKHHDWHFVEVHSTKQGKVKRDQLTSVEGVKNEHWFIDSVMLWTTPRGDVSVNDMRNFSNSGPDDDSPTVASGFPGVGWVQLSCYKDVVLMRKRPNYHYASQNMEAWIDVETRLPTAYKRSDVLYQYKFNPPPTEPLTMPPAYQSFWEALINMRNRRK